MKKLFVIFLTFLFVSACSLGAVCENSLTAGVYAVTASGFGGDIQMEVEIGDAGIARVSVLAHSETQGIGTKAIDALPAAFVSANSAAVDTVAGATMTSNALIDGVTQALNQAAGQAQPAALAMTDGTYTAAAQGYKGPIELSVTIKDNQIAAIDVLSHKETGIIGGSAISLLADAIVAEQSLAVDSISGATVTTAGFMTAISDAVGQAGEGSAALLRSRTIPVRAAVKQDYDCDLVIIGAGMAGLCAAIEAVDNGLDVLVLEKLDVLGGSTSRSEGYVMGADTDFQKENGVYDTVEAFYEDIYSLYQIEPMLNAEMVKKICYDSKSLIPFLQANGVTFEKLVAVSTFDPRATPRNHCSTNKGSGLMTTLYNSAVAKGVRILMGTPAVDILKENGAVVGVKATNKYGDEITVSADATILAAGSYGGNLDMVKELNGNIRAEIIKGCGDGDAFMLAKNAGAQMLLLDYPQLQYYFYWSGIPQLPVYPASAIAPVANILLTDGLGQRVANEADFNFEFVEKVFYSGQQEGYCVVGQKFYEQYPEVCEAGLGKTFPVRGDEIAFKADTVEELAKWAGLDPQVLTATVDRYNALCDAGNDADFNKDAKYMERIDAPYYILKLPAVITDGYSGVKINENAQVVSTDGSVIENFYAAGCCAVPEMSCVNYFGCGTSIATCGVYARAAVNHAKTLIAK